MFGYITAQSNIVETFKQGEELVFQIISSNLEDSLYNRDFDKFIIITNY